MSKHPAAPTTEAWRMFYDSYDKGTMFIGPDVDTAVAEMLDPTEAGKIVAAHNAALAEARAAGYRDCAIRTLEAIRRDRNIPEGDPLLTILVPDSLSTDTREATDR